MQVALEVLIIASAILQNVVASWFSAQLLPWGLPFLIGLVVIYLPLRLKLAATSAAAWTNKKQWVFGALSAGFALFVFVWLVERYIYYGTVKLDAGVIQTYPGELLEHVNRALACAILWKLTPGANQRHGVWLAPGLQMAITAGEIVTGETRGRVCRRWTDLVRRVGEQPIAEFDEHAEGIVSNRSDVTKRPLREIDFSGLLGRLGGDRHSSGA
jgi:hypothetical protein